MRATDLSPRAFVRFRGSATFLAFGYETYTVILSEYAYSNILELLKGEKQQLEQEIEEWKNKDGFQESCRAWRGFKFVGGVMVYEDRKFPFDVKPIYEKAHKEAKHLWERMDALD